MALRKSARHPKESRKSAKPRPRLRSRRSTLPRSRAHAHVVASLRRAVVEMMEPQAFIRLIWDSNQIDIDQVVDQFARSHRADGYRDPGLQKMALDAIQERLWNALPEDSRRDFNTFANGWYSRYLLAVDIGFEMGFAAAKARGRGAES